MVFFVMRRGGVPSTEKEKGITIEEGVVFLVMGRGGVPCSRKD